MYIIFIRTGPELIVAFLSAVTVLHNGTVCVKPFYYTISMVGVFFHRGAGFHFPVSCRSAMVGGWCYFFFKSKMVAGNQQPCNS